MYIITRLGKKDIMLKISKTHFRMEKDLEKNEMAVERERTDLNGTKQTN